MDVRQRAITISLLASVLMLVGKWLAYLLTTSVAIYSDAAESVVHIAATGIAAFSLWYATRPADPDHPYGHGKIAFFSAGFEGALILLASLSIIWSAVSQFIGEPELTRLGVGVAITAGLGLLNLALGLYLITVGRRHGSRVLIANGQHVLTDMWTSLGVVLGVLAVWWTEIAWLDPLVGLAVSAQIAFGGARLIKQSYDGLMDRTDPEVARELLQLLEAGVTEGLVEQYHALRHRMVGDDLFIDVHLLLHGELSLDTAHARITQMEGRIRDAFAGHRVTVSTHPEPVDHAGAHPVGHPEGPPPHG